MSAGAGGPPSSERDRAARPGNRAAPAAPRPVGEALGFRSHERRRGRIGWLEPTGLRHVGPAFDYHLQLPDLRLIIGVRLTDDASLAAVSLTLLDGHLPGYEPDDRPVLLFYPADRQAGWLQAPFILRYADPATGKVRRMHLNRAVDLKRMGLVAALADLEKRRVRFARHEEVVQASSASLRGRLVTLVRSDRPDALAAVYLAARIYPFLALTEVVESPPAPEARQPVRDQSRQRGAEGGRGDQRQRRPQYDDGRPHDRGGDRQRRDRQHANAHHPAAEGNRRTVHEERRDQRHADRGGRADRPQQRQRDRERPGQREEREHRHPNKHQDYDEASPVPNARHRAKNQASAQRPRADRPGQNPQPRRVRSQNVPRKDG